MTKLLKLGRSITIAFAALALIGVASCASAGEEGTDPTPIDNPPPPPPPPPPDASQPDAPVVPDAPVIPDGGGGTGLEGSPCASSSQCAASLCCFGPDLGLPEGFCVPGDEIPGLGCFPI